jgi:hypothetical protein
VSSVLRGFSASGTCVARGAARQSSMNWFRTRIRPCTWLALFALAFQMVVSFGHIHDDDLGLPPVSGSSHTPDVAVASVLTSKAGAPAAGLSAAQVAAHAAVQPTDPERRPDSDDYCPICASMVLAATAIPSLPPLLIVPTPIRHTWPAPTRARSLALQIAQSFNARAPPLA